MKAMHELREKLCKELDKISMKRDMSASDLDTAHKLTDTIKNIDKIMEMEDEYSQGMDYSRTGTWRANMEGDYGHGHSYARRRDSRGRYSRDGNDRDGYSMGNSILDMMEDAMRSAKSDRERDAIRRCIRDMKGE